VLPGRVIVAAPHRVRENVVGIVYLLELLGASSACRVVMGDPVGMGFEGRTARVKDGLSRSEGGKPLIRIANFLRRRS